MAVSILRYDRTVCRFFALFIVLLGFVNKCYCHVANNGSLNNQKDPVKDFILCRECGADVVNSGFIINFLSPKALVLTNQTLFDNTGVDVQYLVNPFGIQFKTITLSTASCHPKTKHWLAVETWYPGYAWKPCYCRRCGHQLGWIFEPIGSNLHQINEPSKDGFYLLILDALISERFSDSVFPGSKLFKT